MERGVQPSNIIESLPIPDKPIISEEQLCRELKEEAKARESFETNYLNAIKPEGPAAKVQSAADTLEMARAMVAPEKQSSEIIGDSDVSDVF